MGTIASGSSKSAAPNWAQLRELITHHRGYTRGDQSFSFSQVLLPGTNQLGVAASLCSPRRACAKELRRRQWHMANATFNRRRKTGLTCLVLCFLIGSGVWLKLILSE